MKAFFCLLILIAQLALVVAHSWEMPVETAAILVIRAFDALPKGTGDAMALTKAATTPHRELHNPLLCPVCRILPQTRHSLMATGFSISLPHRSVTCVPGCTLRYVDHDLAAASPRAPPSLT